MFAGLGSPLNCLLAIFYPSLTARDNAASLQTSLHGKLSGTSLQKGIKFAKASAFIGVSIFLGIDTFFLYRPKTPMQGLFEKKPCFDWSIGVGDKLYQHAPTGHLERCPQSIDVL